METRHPEGGESPFVVKDDASHTGAMSLYEEDPPYVSCSVANCGETIMLGELESHMEMHVAMGSGEETDEDSDLSSIKPKKEEIATLSFGSKLTHALRNLEDIPLTTFENKISPVKSRELDPRASAKAAWKNIMKMPEDSTISKGNPNNKVMGRGPHRLGVSYSPLSIQQNRI